MGRPPEATSTVGALALAVVGGVLHASCFPPMHGWPLAFVAVAPLLIAVRGRSAAVAALLGWIEVTVGSSIVVAPWVSAAAQHYFTVRPVPAWLFALGANQFFGALPSAAFAATAAQLCRLRSAPARVLTIASAWVAIEWLRSTLFTGAPWNLLGHALYAHPLWTQTAEIGGVFLVSWILVTSSAAVAELYRTDVRTRVAACSCAVLVLGLAALYGQVRLRTLDDATGPAITIALVQGNIPNEWRADVRYAGDAFEALAGPTRELRAAHPDLIVWPENAISFVLEPNQRFGQNIRELLGPDGPPLLLGGPRSVAHDGHLTSFNTAYLLNHDGQTIGTYDKRHLVPFAEYTPTLRFPGLAWRFDGPRDLTPGGPAQVLTTPVPFGALICFEAIYPYLSRDLVRGGATLLVNLTNDGWFGTSPELEQHFAMASFRAVETRRSLVRATNTGVTAIVGPSGTILARFPVATRGAWVVRAPLREGQTLYTQVGDVFAWLATMSAIVGLRVVAAVLPQRPAAFGMGRDSTTGNTT